MLKDAACVAYWRAADYAGGDAIPNGKNPGTLDARLGSGAGADAADPKWLDYSGVKYAYNPLTGTPGNRIDTPDSAALSIVGDIDLRCAVALDDWTPAAACCLISKRQTTTTRSYAFDVNATTGTLRLSWSTDGSAVINKDSTVAPTVADGALLLVRVTLDVDNGSGQNEVKFYTKTSTEANAHADLASDSGWTQLGATVTTAGTTSIHDNNSRVDISARQEGNNSAAGKFYAAIIKSGINGTAALDVDFNNAGVTEPFATFTELSANAATMTFQRQGSGRKLAVVDRKCFLLGTDDYFEVPDDASLDFGATDSFSIAVGYRIAGTTLSQALAGKKSASGATTPGYYLSRGSTANQPLIVVADGTVNLTEGSGAAVTQGEASTAIGTRKGTATKQVELFRSTNTNGATTDTTTGTLANADVFRIGALAGGSQFADMVFFGAAVFNRVLTADEVAEVHHELLSGKFVVQKNEQLIWDDRKIVVASPTAWTFARVSAAIKKDFTSVASGLPRYETGRFSQAITVEDGTTNNVARSEELDNAYWTKTLATVTPNAATAPDGTATMDKLVESASSGVHSISKTSAVGSGQYGVYSVYAKKAERSWLVINLDGGKTWFDLANGVIGTVDPIHYAAMQDMGGGIYRCSAGSKLGVIDGTMLLALADADGSDSYAGDGTSGLYLWGLQAERQKRVATSYVKTSPFTDFRDLEVSYIPKAAFDAVRGSVMAWVLVDPAGRGVNAPNIAPSSLFYASGARAPEVSYDGVNSQIIWRAGDTQRLVPYVPAPGWHHFALTWDGADRKLYVDGALTDSASDGLGVDPSGWGSIGLSVGSGGGGGSYVNTQIDEVVIARRVLTPEEIAAAQSATVMPNEQVIVVHFDNSLAIDSIAGSAQMAAQWGVRVPLGFTEQLQWGVRVPVAPVNKQLVWDVRAAVGQESELLWDVRAIVAAALEAPWDVRVATALALDAIWDVRAVMGGTSEIELQWAVRQAASAAVLLLWAERSRKRRCEVQPASARRAPVAEASARRCP